MSLWTYRKAVLESDLPSTLKLVLLVLDNHVNDMGDPCFPAYSRIARLSSLSRRSVISQVNEAEKLGWIAIKHRPGQDGQRHATNLFYLKLPCGKLKSNPDNAPIIGECNSLVQSVHRVGETDSPTMVNLVHSERTSTELSIEPLHRGDSESSELVLPKSVTDVECKAIADLLNEEFISVCVKQQILDELAGAIAAKSIRRGNVAFVHSLIRAERLGKFKPNLGLTVLAAREREICHLEDKRSSSDQVQNALDPDAMEKGVRLCVTWGIRGFAKK